MALPWIYITTMYRHQLSAILHVNRSNVSHMVLVLTLEGGHCYPHIDDVLVFPCCDHDDGASARESRILSWASSSAPLFFL